MDDLKSITFTSLFEVTYDVDVPASSEIPPATTEDVTMDDMIAFSSEVEINKDNLGEQVLSYMIISHTQAKWH